MVVVFNFVVVLLYAFIVLASAQTAKMYSCADSLVSMTAVAGSGEIAQGFYTLIK